MLIAISSFVILLRCITVLARQQKLEQQSMLTEINRKYYESMEQHGISMDLSLDIPAELPFDKTDICALYANALDNAAEACMKLPIAERKIILKSKLRPADRKLPHRPERCRQPPSPIK